MKRAMQLALTLLLCWFGPAQGYITWGPVSHIPSPLDAGPSCRAQQTSANNTWSVVGGNDDVAGADIGVAYVGLVRLNNVPRKAILYTRTINGGESWSTPIELSHPDVDSSGCPSLVRTNLTGQQIVVAFISWETVRDSVIGRVWCRVSQGLGLSWGPREDATVNGRTNPHVSNLSAAASPCHSSPSRQIDLAWEQPYGNYGAASESICNQGFNVHDYGLSIRSEYQYGIVNDELRADLKPRTPSIYATIGSHNAGCAWVHGVAPDDTVYSNWSQYRGLIWDGSPPVIVHGPDSTDDPGFNHGLPTIACLDSSPYNSLESDVVAHEIVASDATREENSTDRELVLSFRDWGAHGQGRTEPATDWYSVWYRPFDVAGPTINLLRPNLYANNRFLKHGSPYFREFADTAYMVFSTKPSPSSSLGDVYYTSIYPDRFHSPWEWRWDEPALLSASADSGCICVYGDMAYASFKSRRPDRVSDSIGVRAGRVNFRPPLVLAEGLPATAGSRRLARLPGSDVIHRTFTVENFVNYESSADNGETWNFQDAPDFGTNPTLALYNGNPVICYLRNDTVFSARLNSDSGWSIKTIFAGTPTCKPGIPSLAVFPNAGAGSRMANACFPLYFSGTGTSKILLAQFDTAATGDVVLDTISSNTTFGDSAVTVAVGLVDTIEVCFEHGDSIYYKYLRFSSITSSPPDTWTKYTLVNTGNTNGRHPYVEKVGSRFYVTYSEHWVEDGDTIWAIKRTSCCDTLAAVAWEGRTSMSAEDEARKDFPSMSSGMAVAWAESSGTHWVIKAKVGDSLLTLTDPDTNSKFVSILADTAVQTSPSTSTTGIYYLWLQQYSGDTWQVPYAGKQVLTSNAEANVTRYNQGRKLLLSTDDTLSSVYRTAAGSIYYSKKKDGVEGWTSSLLRSTGQFPCLTEDYLNRTWVAEHDATSPSTHLIRCQNRAAGSNSWHDFSVYSVSGSGPAFSRIGPPSIVACQNDSSGQNRSAAYIVFTVYTTIPVKSTIVMAKVDTLGVVYVDTLHYVTTYGDSFPSIAACPVAGPGYGLDVAFQSGTEVYTKKTTNSEHPEFTTKRTWSPSYNLSNTPLKSKHPLIAADADTVLVAWVEGDSGAIVTKGQGPGSGYTVWGGLVSVSACPDTVCDNPTIALGDSIIVAYHKKLSATNYDVIARVNFNSNLNLSNSTTTSKYPHCAFHFHNDSFPVISTVWTEELSTNYAEVAYKRWQLGEADGGGIQDYSIFDPNIHPALFAPTPNPFNGLTNIRYQTNIKGLTRVTVMDITGRRVRNLLTMPQSPGVYNLTWNAKDDRERQLPRGVYFLRLETANYNEARKLILTE